MAYRRQRHFLVIAIEKNDKGVPGPARSAYAKKPPLAPRSVRLLWAPGHLLPRACALPVDGVHEQIKRYIAMRDNGNVRVGQDKTPGASLLNYLISQAAIPEYQVRCRWKPNSVAIRDSVATQHYAVSDYGPAPRRMERATIKGDRPTRPSGIEYRCKRIYLRRIPTPG